MTDVYKARSFADDFYNQLHISPRTLDFGFVAADTQLSITIFNGWRVEKNLLAVNCAVSGISTLTTPITVPPLGMLVLPLVVQAGAAAGAFTADVSLVFDDADVVIAISGARPYNSMLWPAMPAWADGVTETLHWLTDVLRSPRGVEQRRQLRDVPRRELRYRYLLTGTTRQRIDNVLSQWFDAEYMIPIITDHQFLSAPMAIGDSSIAAATAYYDFAVGNSILLYRSERLYEICPIESIEANTITLATAVTRAWPTGTHLYPLRVARFQGVPEIQRISDDVAELSINWLIMQRSSHAAAGTGVTFAGYDVINHTPEESRDRSQSLQRLWLELDNGTALPRRTDNGFRGFYAQQQHLLFSVVAERAAFKSLLYKLAGQQGAAWVPSGVADFTLAANAAAGAELLEVANCGYRDYGTNRRYLAIRRNALDWHFCEVIAAGEPSPDADTELVAIAPPLPWPLRTGQGRISFMFLSRLASDVVTIEHVTDTMCTADILWQEVLDNGMD